MPCYRSPWVVYILWVWFQSEWCYFPGGVSLAFVFGCRRGQREKVYVGSRFILLVFLLALFGVTVQIALDLLPLFGNLFDGGQ